MIKNTGKREKIANLLYNIGAVKLLNFFSSVFGIRRRLIVLAYHRIFDLVSTEDEFISDIDLVSASQTDFEWQVRYIKENYIVTTFSEYFNVIKKNPGKDLIIITFDDGFKDNYDIAYPILKKHEVPAVFFVSVDYIGTDNHFWFELLVSILRQTPEVHLKKICDLIEVPFLVDRLSLQVLALNYMKKVPNSKRLSIIKSITEFCKANNILVLDAAAIPMSWANIIEMSANGMELGSHTLSHPILTNLSSSQRNDEIFESKRMLEQKLHKECVCISYPNGGLGDYDVDLMREVKETGYKFGCSYIPGINYVGSLKTYELKRIHVERYITKKYFVCMLALPILFN